MSRSVDQEYEFRHCQPNDLPRLLEILEDAYGLWPRFDIDVDPIDHLRWQLESPAAATSVNWVAEVGGRIGSIHIGYARTALLSGAEVSLWYGTDSATSPAFQGRGLYSSLRERWLEEARLEHDLFATSPVNPVVVRALGREEQEVDLGNAVRLRVKVIDAKRLARAPHSSSGLRGNGPLRILAFSCLKHFSFLRQQRNRWPTLATKPHRIEQFDQRVDDLWSEVSRQFDFILERRKDFLNWRYCDRRSGDYAVLVSEERSHILGYVAVKMSKGRAYLDDLFVAPGRDDVVSSLVESAENYARQRGAAALHCQLVRLHPYNAVLAAHGFVDARLSYNLVCLPLRLEPHKLALLKEPGAALHLTAGDLI